MSSDGGSRVSSGFHGTKQEAEGFSSPWLKHMLVSLAHTRTESGGWVGAETSALSSSWFLLQASVLLCLTFVVQIP